LTSAIGREHWMGRSVDFISSPVPDGTIMAIVTHGSSPGDETERDPSQGPGGADPDNLEETLVADGSVRRIDEMLGETVAYQGDESLLNPDGSRADLGDDDGFPAVDDLENQTLGQYRLGTVIGRGSMGRVYRAEHLGLHRPCAIKVMNPGLVATQPQVREDFWAEARVVANLVHPHVVTIHNLGDDRGYHYIEMEYVPGGLSLKESLAEEGPFDPIRAATLVRQVVLALGAAHQSGLVHRDVKPSNVLLAGREHAKLADFGLVRHLSELERAGVPIAGTPTFMAPELFEGVPASRRSDLYAVGVMYYALLSGGLPFHSKRLTQLIQLHRTAPIPDLHSKLPDVPRAVIAIVAKCMAKRPEHRYSSAEDLADDLAGVITGLRDTESLVRESVDGLPCLVQGGRDQFRVLFPLPDERLQEVYLEVTIGRQGERFFSVFSVCGPANPEHFEFALQLNAELTYGSISVRNVDGKPMFVMTRTFPRERINPMDVRAALLEIARRADGVEQQLTDADLY
jgi:eukaryotic-like serine/threonine-protein kinase